MPIRPFAAIRYNAQQVPDLSRVIAPPYDVISAEEQARLYDRSPYNIVRLTLGKQSPQDSEQDNRYTRARRDFLDWSRGEILRRDAAPALYVVEHAFTDQITRRTRLGFIAVIELDPAAEPPVHRHELTLAAPKADRTKLLDAIPANLEPIFCVYPDQDGAIHARVRQAASAKPIMQVSLNHDRIRVWALTDAEAVGAITQAVSALPLLIADGHHRFEVAYANRHRYPRVMSYFVSMAEPSLVVRPIHRMISSAHPADREALERVCTVRPADNLDHVQHRLTDQSGGTALEGRFGWFDGQGWYHVAIKPDVLARWLMAPSVPLPLAKLDVCVLHGAVLPGLGVPDAAVRYTASVPEALQAVSQGEASSCWLLRGIPLAQVHAMAVQHLTLPPKSTYFYPKVPSGLVINPLDDPAPAVLS